MHGLLENEGEQGQFGGEKDRHIVLDMEESSDMAHSVLESPPPCALLTCPVSSNQLRPALCDLDLVTPYDHGPIVTESWGTNGLC